MVLEKFSRMFSQHFPGSIDGTGRESTKINQIWSGFVREGPGSPKNVPNNLKYGLKKSKSQISWKIKKSDFSDFLKTTEARPYLIRRCHMSSAAEVVSNQHTLFNERGCFPCRALL